MQKNIRLYNSLTKRSEDFAPGSPDKVSIYNCGPTVYKRQHLGNMRRFLFADFLRRTLEFFGYQVLEVTNITDVGHLTESDLDAGEDKLSIEALRQKITPQAIATREIKQFMADLQALNIQPAHEYPQATGHIKQMQDLIAKLLNTACAYQVKSGIYFDVQSFPGYGKLSGNTLDKIAAGKRITPQADKKHPADFALWVFSTTALQKWDSPWGTGYPGWHIECSAMSMAYLDTPIDIHTGGIDNKFPHHENEIAQAESALGHAFVKYWLHNGHLQLGGKKIAKSSGRQVTLDDVAQQGYSPLAFRAMVFSAHYRKPLDFSWDQLAAAEKNINSIRELLRRINKVRPSEADESVLNNFSAALADDLNTPKALTVFLGYVKQANAALDKDAKDSSQILATILKMDQVLALVSRLNDELTETDIPPQVQKLADDRENARTKGNFDQADVLRSQINALGYNVVDTAHGPLIEKDSH